MLFSFFKFAPVQMEPSDIQMPYGFLGERPVRSAVPENAFEPAQGLAEISAEARGQSEIVGDEPYVAFVAVLFRDLESDPELMLRFDPVPLGDQAKPAGIGAFEKGLRVRQ